MTSETTLHDAAPMTRWLLRLPDQDASARIFCFPYSGVGGSMFNQWPRRIGGIEICAIQLPGRENRLREGHYGTYAALAEALAESLLPHLDRPFAFFGHCAGALPAFETARLLAERGLPIPQRLFVSAQVAPHDCPHDRFLDMSDDELRAELEFLTITRGGQVQPQLIELGLAILREDLAANRVYRRLAPIEVPFPITVLHWSDDPEVTPDELRGWQHYGTDVRFPLVAGGHYDFLSAPEPLLRHLSEPFAPQRGACE
ncbi:thioesterase domain-containing protein [Nocardia ninae]|uniref:Thioesterase TesA n=1 Tax=Nocardia ninae NBRC 108245 TaxID=1210091 RepID=A0A511MBY2_9NOCA|nr:thioesterase domain-containing protein [Nocardia ninae]GEM38001.1 thioesterase [Nocardia ninae NBRC 108245]